MRSGKKASPVTIWDVLLFCFLLFMFLGQLQAHDLWWHLQAGGLVLKNMAVPEVDMFSYTAAGRPWVYHSWLGGLVLRVMYDYGGLVGLITLRAIIFAASLAVAALAARSRGVSRGLVAVLLLGCVFQIQMRALLRPYAFSFIFFAFFYYRLQQSFQLQSKPGSTKWSFMWGEQARLLLLPASMILWANVHGGFHVGLLLLGAFGVAEMVRVATRTGGDYLHELLVGSRGARFRAYLFTGVLSLFATLLNPYGAAVLTYPIRVFSEVSFISRIAEWQPVELNLDFAVFWGMGGLLFVCFLRTFWMVRRREDAAGHLGQLLVDVMVAGGFFLLALRAVRNVSWFLLVMPAILGYHLGIQRHVKDRTMSARRRSVYGILAAVTILALGCWHIGQLDISALMDEEFPGEACQYLDDHDVPGRTYNVYEWGGYLIWRRWPEHRVFIDGRCLVYGDELINESFSVARGREGWRDILRKYDVRSLLLRYGEYDSVHFFEGDGQWECIYWDDRALIAVKRGTAKALSRYNLTNPVTFSDRLEEEPTEVVLEELDRVLTAHPTSWRAWMFRAQALLKEMKKRRRPGEKLTRSARTAARRAVELSGGAEEAKKVLENISGGMGSE